MLPIHVINLEHRQDRKAKLLQEFQKHRIKNYTFVPAVVGATLNLDELRAGPRPMKPGEYGCYLSHLQIFQKILASPEELHLILEDDIYFIIGFNTRLRKLLTKVKHIEWDIFYLGINCSWPDCQEGEFVGNPQDGIYYPREQIWGTHAYLIKKTTVAKIMPQMLPITLPIDVHLMCLDLKRLTLINTLVKTYNADSDIQPS